MNAVDVLERWNIRHLSPSSINAWASDRCDWVIRYGLKHREPSSPAMIRGNAVEAGLNALLARQSLEEATAAAERLFALQSTENGLTDDDGEFDATIQMVGQAAKAVEEYRLPRPIATQLRLEPWLDFGTGAVPILSFADFVFADHTLDCKSTKQLPSAPKPAHVAQVAVYAKARNETRADLLYLTGKKYARYSVEADQIDAAWRMLQLHARSLIRALARAKDLADLCADNPPPIDSWMWTPERRLLAAELAPEWAA